ncbi:hypothetical protein BJ987_005936 [Nocardia goodfellowii]|uniref:Uncharacterized protein n=1 Tax=Nocardia goodfellowii TaxID=882446 RepID=A0ABS4QMV3_9NOCA|nr:hypothetical protein [Nocardia goodfellowii]
MTGIGDRGYGQRHGPHPNLHADMIIQVVMPLPL